MKNTISNCELKPFLYHAFYIDTTEILYLCRLSDDPIGQNRDLAKRDIHWPELHHNSIALANKYYY